VSGAVVGLVAVTPAAGVGSIVLGIVATIFPASLSPVKNASSTMTA
jgi:ammonia channel protein AmtB